MTQDESLNMASKVVLITGAARGIGSGIAEVLVAAGANVVLSDLDAEAVEKTAIRLSKKGPGQAVGNVCDVRVPDQIKKSIDQAAKQFGRLDCLVNNAAIFSGWREIDKIDYGLIGQLFQVNIIAYIIASQLALPYLRVHNGTIVNISSIAGELGLWHDSVYSATKGAVTAFTKALAVEEAVHGVRVNAVVPGNIHSHNRAVAVAGSTRGPELDEFLDRWQWMGRSGTPEEVGRAVLFLATDMSSFCTGVSLMVTGGLELGAGIKEPYPDFGRPTPPVPPQAGER